MAFHKGLLYLCLFRSGSSPKLTLHVWSVGRSVGPSIGLLLQNLKGNDVIMFASVKWSTLIVAPKPPMVFFLLEEDKKGSGLSLTILLL